jgi:hypothetical protein
MSGSAQVDEMENYKKEAGITFFGKSKVNKKSMVSKVNGEIKYLRSL